MKRALRHIVPAISFAALSQSIEAFAKPMPESVPEELARILAAEEFQPRDSDQTFLGRIGEYLAQKFFDFAEPLFKAISEMLDKLSSSLPSNNPFSLELPEWLKAFFANIADWSPIIFKTLLLLSAIYLLVRFLIIPFVQSFGTTKSTAENETSIAPELHESASTPSRSDLQILFQQKDFDRLLTGLRLHLREQIEAQISAAPSVTDRVLSQALKPEINSGKLFQDVAASFEQRAFAAEEIQPEIVQNLYTQFTRQGAA